MSSLRDLSRLYRVRDWLHFLPLPLAGYWPGGAHSLRALVGGVLGWGLGLAYASAINQAFDDRLDRPSAGKNPVGGAFGRRQAVLLSIPPALGSIAVCAWLSPQGLGAALALVVAATVYSAPPRLKRIPVLGTLWNVVVGLPGLFFAGSPDLLHPSLGLLVFLFALLLVVSQLIHEAEDREDDRLGGIASVATIAGVKGALLAAALFLLVMPGVSFWLAGGLRQRAALTVSAALFSTAWVVALADRIRRGDSTALRRLRLRYRYAALAFGALAFFLSFL